MKTYLEIIAFRIKAEGSEQFESIKEQLVQETRQIDGLLWSTTHQDTKSANSFVDIMSWESPKAARQGFEIFKSLPSTQQFLELIDGPPIFRGVFKKVAGN